MPRRFVLSDEIINHSINNPAFNEHYKYNAPEKLNNLDLFTLICKMKQNRQQIKVSFDSNPIGKF